MGSVPVHLNGDIRRKMSGNRSVSAKGPPQEVDELIKVAKVVKSNTFSNKSSFRETDDMYLQRKAKIWLSEILRVILKEEALVADLLADGELLFNLAMVLRKKVAKLPTGSTNPEAIIFEKIPSGRNNERYMAYPKIDSFLTICKVIGLRSIDLFSPSDVVEKRNTRGVCLCLRTLSKKARSKDLDVPDFDTVTFTTPMSKDMVRLACKNLKQPQIGRQNSDPIGLRVPPIHKHSAVDGDGYLQDIEGAQKNFPFEMAGTSSSSGSSDGSGSLSPSRTGSAKTVDDLDDMRLLLDVSHFLDQSYLNDLHFSEENTNKDHKKQDYNLSSQIPMPPEDGLDLRCYGDVKRQTMFESSTWDPLCDDRSKESSVGSLEEDFPPEHVDEDVVRCEPVEAEVPGMKVEEEKAADPRDKRPKNMFLKTIGNGVLLAGGLLFALQFSGGNGGGNNGFGAAIKRPREMEETNKESAPRKAEVGMAGGVYSSRDWFRF